MIGYKEYTSLTGDISISIITPFLINNLSHAYIKETLLFDMFDMFLLYFISHSAMLASPVGG